ncbi:MAG: glutamine--fructose-6-phosphate transaminase (isomerizing) [Eubacteriales bacterium]
MCGIVGYAGEGQAAPFLLEGLEKLEYRGYDSAGIAVYNNGGLEIVKCKGRLSVLSDKTSGGKTLGGVLGIGHTRWATHGEPSDVNSHPQISASGRFAVVHNGIIENYLQLKDFLIRQGMKFLSETDTEVIAQLIEHFYDGDILNTVAKVVSRLSGSYALGVICADNPDSMIAVRKDSPLIIGIGEGENFIASDVTALLSRTRRIYRLDDHEMALITKDSIEIFSPELERVEKAVVTVDWDIQSAEKGGYSHFMFKEIMEQPKAIRDTVNPRILDGKIVLDTLKLTPEQLRSYTRIFIIACGSAYHVGFAGKYIIEKLAGIPVEVCLASEFRYSDPVVDDKSLVIAISQSGETADTLAAVREAKRRGGRVLGVINVVGSSIAGAADDVIYTWAGPEIAVATTKAYSSQLSVMYLIAIYMAKALDRVSEEQYALYVKALAELPSKIEKVLEDVDNIQYFASKSFNLNDIFFIGRGLDYALSMEGSLKLKEISYVHSEAYAAGELKHGTISLIEKGTLVVALCTQGTLLDKMLSNIREVKTRGAVVLALVTEGGTDISSQVDYTITLPATCDILMPSLAVVPMQLFAYYIASLRGCDIDKPRNLAKSVTVE